MQVAQIVATIVVKVTKKNFEFNVVFLAWYKKIYTKYFCFTPFFDKRIESSVLGSFSTNVLKVS